MNVPPTTLTLDTVLERQAWRWIRVWNNWDVLLLQSSPYSNPLVDFRTGFVIDGTGLVVRAIQLGIESIEIVLVDAGDTQEART